MRVIRIAKQQANTSVDIVQQTVQYFRPPQPSFWHWAEDGHLVELHSGETLCYREELTDLLRGQEGIGLLRFGSVLLVLAACQDSWAESDRIGSMIEHLGRKNYSYVKICLQRIKPFLDLLAELPPDLRKGRKRIHLLRSLTARTGNRKVTTAELPHLLDLFNSGQLDGQIFKTTDDEHYSIEWDLTALRLISQHFKSVAELEHHLRTGLDETPDPAPLDIPDDSPPADLLEELARDTETAGLAHLAQRLVAALHIPLHARGSSDLPLGGVSDITNRGDFDRLLLSELAQDDLTLTARLVNNEALFLRREEPPQHLDRQRTVLMDTTLKMWGLPRVFALSTALACARQEKQAAAVRAFALGGEGFEPMDLHTKEGVTTALTHLNVALHCGGGLRAFFAETPPHDTHDYILLSDADAMRDPDFQAAFAEIRLRLRFLAVLHRDGRLEFFEYTNGHRKLLFSPKFDLDALLFPKGKTPRPEPKRLDGGLVLPAFFQQNPPPLRFPVPGIKNLKKRGFEDTALGLVLVTQHQRVLYWDDYGKGAQELLPYIELGEAYQISFGSMGYIYILVLSNGGYFSKVYRLAPRRLSETLLKSETDRVWSFDLTKKAGLVHSACFSGHHLFVHSARAGIFGMDCQTGESIPTQMDQHYDFDQPEIQECQQEYRNRPLDVAAIREKLNIGYRSIITAKYIGLDLKAGWLMLDNYSLEVNDDGNLIWNDSPAIISEQSAQPTQHQYPDNPKVGLLARTWADGSQALLDSRGLLHLHSSHPEVPDITILAVANHPVAAWAADGTLGGHPYFLPSSSENGTCSGKEFYHLFIVPFMRHLKANAQKM